MTKTKASKYMLISTISLLQIIVVIIFSHSTIIFAQFYLLHMFFCENTVLRQLYFENLRIHCVNAKYILYFMAYLLRLSTVHIYR